MDLPRPCDNAGVVLWQSCCSLSCRFRLHRRCGRSMRQRDLAQSGSAYLCPATIVATRIASSRADTYPKLIAYSFRWSAICQRRVLEGVLPDTRSCYLLRRLPASFQLDLDRLCGLCQRWMNVRKCPNIAFDSSLGLLPQAGNASVPQASSIRRCWPSGSHVASSTMAVENRLIYPYASGTSTSACGTTGSVEEFSYRKTRWNGRACSIHGGRATCEFR